MTSGPRYNCPQCDGQLHEADSPSDYECTRCGDVVREVRTARVTPDGCTVFLSGADLTTLGVDPSVTDEVEVHIREGRVCLTPAGGGGQ